MNKSALPKLAAVLLGCFVVILVAMFFLYPYLNEENYEQIQAERSERHIPEGEDPYVASGDPESVPVDSNLVTNVNFSDDGEGSAPVELSEAAQIDSLLALNDSLMAELSETQRILNNLETFLEESGADPDEVASVMNGEGNAEILSAATAEPEEDFSERIKSLLNLDEEDLEPIANQMSQNDLVRIYRNSGNIQREKLLRSLSSERAADLMKEVML